MTADIGMVASVIVPCRGACADLPKQLQALAAQTSGGPSVEVILADNGAPTLEAVARSFRDVLDIRVVDATNRIGTAYARNVGMRNAHTDLFLFCDSDDVVGPTWVADGVRKLSEVAAFSGGAVPFTGAELAPELDVVWALLEERLPAYCAGIADEPLHTYPVLLGCSFGLRREMAIAVAGFDVAFGSQAEDNDLAFRLQRELGYLPRAPHVAVAYRVRERGSGSLSRSMLAGLNHAGLCERHQAWTLSPSYGGRWLLRPLRELLEDSRPRRDVVGTLAGLILGRLWYRRWRHQQAVATVVLKVRGRRNLAGR